MNGVSKKLIILESDPLIATLIETEVREYGWEVDGVASDEDAALDFLKTVRPDLAILDIGLDSLNDTRIAAACRSRGTPFVLMTGSARREVPAEWELAAVVAKPFTSEDLRLGMEEALKRASLISLRDS
ncbi:response regulator [Pelagibacterium limicola]|uniref:response regulator n=1 Tax=Pelagibacterium limicola TaxID=2791022 RepID=UPI0018AF609B|nr:response regulator [Pelagibacterium limicola]